MTTLKQIIKKAQGLYGKNINESSFVDEILLPGKGWYGFCGTIEDAVKCYDYFSGLHLTGYGDVVFSIAVFSWWYEDHGLEGVKVFSSLEVDNVDIPYDNEGSLVSDRIKAQCHTPKDSVFFEIGPGGVELRAAILSNYNTWMR